MLFPKICLHRVPTACLQHLNSRHRFGQMTVNLSCLVEWVVFVLWSVLQYHVLPHRQRWCRLVKCPYKYAQASSPLFVRALTFTGWIQSLSNTESCQCNLIRNVSRVKILSWGMLWFRQWGLAGSAGKAKSQTTTISDFCLSFHKQICRHY